MYVWSAETTLWNPFEQYISSGKLSIEYDIDIDSSDGTVPDRSVEVNEGYVQVGVFSIAWGIQVEGRGDISFA